MYQGSEIPAHELVTLTKSRSVRFMTIDGLDTGISQEFKLRPGEHAVDLEVYRMGNSPLASSRFGGSARSTSSRYYMCRCTVTLETQAGVGYHLQGGRMDTGWGAWATRSVRRDAAWPDVRGLDPPHCRCAGQ